MIKECYQIGIRNKKSKTEVLDFDIKEIELRNSYIKPIEKELAGNVAREFEWIKKMPHNVKHCFGIYFKTSTKDVLGGILIFSTDASENTGTWDGYGINTDELLLLSRGVSFWWTPKNTASYFISRACKWLKKNTKCKIITSNVDPAEGEVGTIYQALNWHYVGLMSGNYRDKEDFAKFSVIIDDKLYYKKWFINNLGCAKRETILKHYPNAQFIPQYRKRRYFHFIDTPTNNRKYIKALKHLFQPSYPKRNKDIVGLIYKISNPFNNKTYIGQTYRSLTNRIQDYRKVKVNTYLSKAFNKYGFNNFIFEIIDVGYSIDDLNQKEIDYIKQYNSNHRDYGYNIHVGGRNTIVGEETRKKMSEAHKGRKQSKEWVEKRIPKKGSKEALKHGRPKTEEDKKYLSKVSTKHWSGQKRPQETIEKIKQTKKERGPSQKQLDAARKKVYLKNPDDMSVIATFDCCRFASESNYCDVGPNTVSRYCKQNKIIDRILWTYEP